ncbi:chorismate mutase [Streptomyces sp. NPDC057239]|uniref:chorismate mutase n=1 Tax=Streptomyces sp. NPDC057239 TaxID=3346061 RepID=UPI003625EA6D
MPRATDSPAEGLHTHIAELDAAIIELVRRRTEICTRLATQRRAAGRPTIELARENDVLRRYSEALGRPGASLAMLLTELGRR